MKLAEDTFEQLQDLAPYLGSDYLKCPLSDNVLDEISYLNGALAFLLDRLLFKENAGKEVTDQVRDSLRLPFNPKKLSDLALSINESIKDAEFLKQDTSFCKYYSFITETEKYIESAVLDEYGLLTLCYLKNLSSLIEIDAKAKGLDPLKVNEIVFLNGTYSIALILKGFFGPKFISLKSFDFFDEVSLHASRVRTEILD